MAQGRLGYFTNLVHHPGEPVELTPLRSFLAIAEFGHLTRAAQALHITQPALSMQLKNLEEELGHRLFHRTPKGMVLTEAGMLFLATTREGISRLDAGTDALRALAGLDVGRLRIGGGATATTYLLPPVLGAFHAAHGNVQLYVREQGSAGVVQAVASGELDLGIVTLSAETEQNQAIDVAPWLEDELLLLVPPGHVLQNRKRYDPGDLNGSSLVHFEAGTAVRQIIDRFLHEAGADVHVAMELRSIESIKQMVGQGIGAAFVSQFAVEAGEPFLRARGQNPSRRLGIITARHRTPSVAASAFLDLLRAPPV